MNQMLQKAVGIVGGQTALAKKLGVRQQHVWNWLHRDKAIRAERAIEIEHATNGQVTRYELRPDLFGPPTEPCVNGAGRINTKQPSAVEQDSCLS